MPAHAPTTLPGIGGFLPLELPATSTPDGSLETPPGAVHVNSGRNALLLIASGRSASRVHLPMLGCGSLAEPLERHDIDVSWYRVGRDLLPVDLPPPRPDELVVLCDIHGMVGDSVRELACDRPDAVLDLSHAAVAPGLVDTPWFASYRKMFGVADGAVAVLPGVPIPPLETDRSTDRYLARLQRHDEGPEVARPALIEAEKAIDNAPLQAMSHLTRRILAGVDREAVAVARRRNFDLLDELLTPAGITRIAGDPGRAPFCWPLLSPSPCLHARLHEAGVYAPVLWPDVATRAGEHSDEAWMSRHCVPLPVDQHLDILAVGELARRVIEVTR